jgi:hypothetical protein
MLICDMLSLVDATAINLTAVFRMLAAVSSSFDEAMRYCGVVLNLFVMYVCNLSQFFCY